MRIEFLFLSVLFGVFANASSTAPLKDEKERFLIASGTYSFTTFTLIKVSTTTTSTFTTTSTCTTSTAALTTCTVGRRRRGLFYDQDSLNENRLRRGLFYNEEEFENNDGTHFLAAKKKDDAPIDEVPITSFSEDIVIPLEIQDGFSLPENLGSNRFLLAFGTSTVTSISITTTYLSLTAICSSTTGFPICGGVGK